MHIYFNFRFYSMAGLKADLDKYLSGSKSSSTLSNLTKSLTLPTLKSPFSKDSSKNGDDEEALISDHNGESDSSSAGWYESKADCLPTLTKKQRIFGFVTSLGLGLFFFSFATLYIPVMVIIYFETHFGKLPHVITQPFRY